MLRKIKSCPANLSNMAHRKKPTQSESNEIPIFVIPARASRMIKKGDAVDEIVVSTLLDAKVEDPTEQLLFLMILRKIFSKTKTTFSNAFYEICLRTAISCITHKLMENAITTLHSHVQLIH
tara:strand:+ start:197 stop:562 length:366 start_codon:yes stop_codon:yes gene_type:complete